MSAENRTTHLAFCKLSANPAKMIAMKLYAAPLLAALVAACAQAQQSTTIYTQTDQDLTSAAAVAGDGISLEESKRLRNFGALFSSENLELSKLKLRNLIRVAEEYSPALREGDFTALAAGQDIEAAKGARLPQVTLTGQSLYTDGDIARASRANGKPATTLTAQYALYDWGRIEANIRGREQAQQAAFARKTLINRQLVSDTVGVCLELNKQRAIYTANIEYLQKLRTLQEKLTKIVAEDPGRSGELVQVRSRSLQGESQAELVRSRVREISIRLERLVGPGRQELCADLGPSLMTRPPEDEILREVDLHPQLLILEAEYQQALRNAEQISATRKPQVTVRADHAPIAASVTNDYQQVVTLAATVPLYDGNTLLSSERAALERSNAALERIETARNQLSSDLRERARFAAANLQRASDFVGLLEVNDRVRKDFFLQWATLGRRTLFELLAIEAEQLTLQSGYFNSLYDGMINVANVRANLGHLSEDLSK